MSKHCASTMMAEFLGSRTFAATGLRRQGWPSKRGAHRERDCLQRREYAVAQIGPYWTELRRTATYSGQFLTESGFLTVRWCISACLGSTMAPRILAS